MGMTLINFMMSIEFDFEFEFLLKIYRGKIHQSIK